LGLGWANLSGSHSELTQDDVKINFTNYRQFGVIFQLWDCFDPQTKTINHPINTRIWSLMVTDASKFEDETFTQSMLVFVYWPEINRIYHDP
jgi:hypothetical protein